jgi:F-type H+-transporting ATPase subunit b
MRTWFPIALVLILLVVVAAPAWAGDPPAEAGGEHGSGGLEWGKQLDLRNILTSIGVFLILLVVLAKTAWKPILDGLQKREQTIQQALDDAKDAHERAKALIAEYEAKLDKARDEAQAIFEETRRDAQDIRSQIEEDARKRADETVARAGREIEQMTAKAWDRLVRDAAGIATEAASRIIRKELSPEGHADIVGAVVGEFAASRAAAPGGGGAA